MKAEFQKDGTILISPENTAESIALDYMFIKELDTAKSMKNIVVTSQIPDNPELLGGEQ